MYFEVIPPLVLFQPIVLSPPQYTSSHTVNLRILRPLPKRLAIIPEDDPAQTPQGNQTHVCHDRRDVSILGGPRSNELRESVTPDILVDRDGNEDGSRDGLVGIN